MRRAADPRPPPPPGARGETRPDSGASCPASVISGASKWMQLGYVPPRMLGMKLRCAGKNIRSFCHKALRITYTNAPAANTHPCVLVCASWFKLGGDVRPGFFSMHLPHILHLWQTPHLLLCPIYDGALLYLQVGRRTVRGHRTRHASIAASANAGCAPRTPMSSAHNVGVLGVMPWMEAGLRPRSTPKGS